MKSKKKQLEFELDAVFCFCFSIKTKKEFLDTQIWRQIQLSKFPVNSNWKKFRVGRFEWRRKLKSLKIPILFPKDKRWERRETLQSAWFDSSLRLIFNFQYNQLFIPFFFRFLFFFLFTGILVLGHFRVQVVGSRRKSLSSDVLVCIYNFLQDLNVQNQRYIP